MFRYFKAAMVVVFLLFAAFFWAGKRPACREIVDRIGPWSIQAYAASPLENKDNVKQILKFIKK